MSKKSHQDVVIAEAAGHATAGGNRNSESRGNQVERAMAEATQQCLAEGITDPDVIRERKLAAREAVRAVVPTGTNAHGVEHRED